MKILKNFVDCVHGPYSQSNEMREFKMSLVSKLPDLRIAELSNVLIINTKYEMFAVKIRMCDTKEDGSVDIEKIHERIRNVDFIEISKRDYCTQEIKCYNDIVNITNNLVKPCSFTIFNMDDDIDYKKVEQLLM